MSTHQQIDKRTRADAHFKAREILRADADQARHDYYAAQAEVLHRTERLRTERLAREAKQSNQKSRPNAAALRIDARAKSRR